MQRFPNVTVVDHPLVQHKLSLMRNKETSTANFRRLLREVALLIGYEITRDLPLETRAIETPVGPTQAPFIEGKKLVIAPVLRAMQGQGTEPVLHALLDTPQQPKAGLRYFLRATFHLDDDGRLHARALPQQQPFRIRPFAQADGWIVLGEDAGDCEAGRVVQVASLGPGDALRIQAFDGKGSP